MFLTLCKLENLSEIKETKLYVHAEATGTGKTACNSVVKHGKVVNIIFDSGNTLLNASQGTVIFSIPEGFRPKKFVSVNAGVFNQKPGAIYIEPSGIATWRGDTINASVLFTVSYII